MSSKETSNFTPSGSANKGFGIRPLRVPVKTFQTTGGVLGGQAAPHLRKSLNQLVL